jgi:hypothetical protein
MGMDVSPSAFSREDRARYRRKVRRCLDVFALMLNDFTFDAERPTTGLEIELNLIDPECEPAMRNAEVLADIADPTFQTELGQFNLELNVPPRLIAGTGFSAYQQQVRGALQHADERAQKSDARVVLIGILPTLTQSHTVLDNISTNSRYRLLNEQILVRRVLERRPGDRRAAGGARRELAVPVRPAALGRDADRPVRAGHRHPSGRAEGTGCPAAGLVR